ncbi:cell cycle progression protein 1-like isoform X3 [Scleropages formosus]|uniref:cell cycle progression protein 1-like isoform X3 n=1 Tax=Scleropages formosus TaxID=113540 RepID=UPI0010FACE41|nr:cell cycle progression protein 1-like isoform X3 [Scleropages formosus]
MYDDGFGNADRESRRTRSDANAPCVCVCVCENEGTDWKETRDTACVPPAVNPFFLQLVIPPGDDDAGGGGARGHIGPGVSEAGARIRIAAPDPPFASTHVFVRSARQLNVARHFVSCVLSPSAAKMSESSSDTDSSPWTIISNEGSDIEALGLEDGGGGGESRSESPPSTEEVRDRDGDGDRDQDQEGLPVPCGMDPLITMLQAALIPPGPESYQQEEAREETEPVREVGADGLGTEAAMRRSASMKGAELAMWAGPKTEGAEPHGREFHLDTIGVAQTRVFPVAPPAGGSSSSEEEPRGQLPGPLMRKRRVKLAGAPVSAEGGTSGQPEQPKPGQKEMQRQEPETVEPGVITLIHGIFSSTLSTCILLALVVTLSLSLGYLYGTFHVQEMQKAKVETVRLEDLMDARGDQRSCEKGAVQSVVADLQEKAGMASPLAENMDQNIRESTKLVVSEDEPQKEDIRLKHEESGRTEEDRESEQVSRKSQQLKSSLECEEKSVSTLQEELRNLRSQIRNLEWKGVDTHSVLHESQQSKGHEEEERQRMLSFMVLREVLTAEARVLRRELDRERRVTGLLKEELGYVGPAGMANKEIEELQARLEELERKLNFERQRSDLWEKLYMKATDERATGDIYGTVDKVKDMEHVAKNCTKALVHHHEQIKKDKEETFRKFPDTVNPLFRYYKDSAKSFFGKDEWHHMRRPFERRDSRGERCEQRQTCLDHRGTGLFWQHKSLLQLLPRASDNFEAVGDGQTPGVKVHVYPHEVLDAGMFRGCSGVTDCAYQESISLFNKPLDPVRMEDFSQLLYSYLQQETDHFHRWEELQHFIDRFFDNGVFIHHQMMFTDFVSGVEDYLKNMDEFNMDMFKGLDKYIYRHFFGDSYSEWYEQSSAERASGHHQSHQKAHVHLQRDRKWTRPRETRERHIADVKIELDPTPFHPKY